jgi:hypothetical protein
MINDQINNLMNKYRKQSKCHVYRVACTVITGNEGNADATPFEYHLTVKKIINNLHYIKGVIKIINFLNNKM